MVSHRPGLAALYKPKTIDAQEQAGLETKVELYTGKQYQTCDLKTRQLL